MGCLNATITQKQTGITVNVAHRDVSISASVMQTCDVFIGLPLYVADSRLYAADAALYVCK